MDKNEIKKELYKQAPKAHLLYIRKGVAYYTARVNGAENSKNINFEVPVDDMGDADYTPMMEAKLLIRYLTD